MRIKIFFILGFVFFSLTANSQQASQFTTYALNKLFYNPAYSGVEGVTKLTLTHRSQWAGYNPTFGLGGAPTTQLFSMTTPIFKYNSGFGAYVINDQLGPLNYVQAHGSLAYHIGIKNSKLSLGARVGAIAQIINSNIWEYIDQDDPELQGFSGRESEIRPDLSLGAFFRAEKYYVGISFNHLLKSEFDFEHSDITNPYVTHSYLMVGYNHQVNFDLKLAPSVLLQSADFFNQWNFMVGGLAYYKEKIWGGVNFIQGEEVNLLFGYNFLKDQSLSFGYSFGYIVQAQEAKQPTSHEVVMSYSLPVNPGSGKKVVRTPRFRH